MKHEGYCTIYLKDEAQYLLLLRSIEPHHHHVTTFFVGFPLHTFYIINRLFFLSTHHLPIINFPTYFYTFFSLSPLFYLFIFLLLSTLISLFFYSFIVFFIFYSSYSYPLTINLQFTLCIVFPHTKCYFSLSQFFFSIFWWILLFLLHFYFKLINFCVLYNSTLG